MEDYIMNKLNQTNYLKCMIKTKTIVLGMKNFRIFFNLQMQITVNKIFNMFLNILILMIIVL